MPGDDRLTGSATGVLDRHAGWLHRPINLFRQWPDIADYLCNRLAAERPINSRSRPRPLENGRYLPDKIGNQHPRCLQNPEKNGQSAPFGDQSQ